MEHEPSTGSPSDQLDRQLAARALAKRRDGKTPTSQESSALRRVERAEEEKKRWAFYRTIPQKHWREMSGRQAKVLAEQAERYGLPFGDALVDLPAVVKALHDFLRRNAGKLAAEDDPLMAGGDSPALERYRDERAKLARLDRLDREKTLVSREKAHEGLGRIAGIVRRAGESLQRLFGPDAARVLHEALNDAEREIDSLFGDPDHPDDPTDGDPDQRSPVQGKHRPGDRPNDAA